MKIIILKKTKGKGGYMAYVVSGEVAGKLKQTFAPTPSEALKMLADKL